MADYCMCMCMRDISGRKRRKAGGKFQSSLDSLRSLPEVILDGTGIFLGRKMVVCAGEGFPEL